MVTNALDLIPSVSSGVRIELLSEELGDYPRTTGELYRDMKEKGSLNGTGKENLRKHCNYLSRYQMSERIPGDGWRLTERGEDVGRPAARASLDAKDEAGVGIDDLFGNLGKRKQAVRLGFLDILSSEGGRPLVYFQNELGVSKSTVKRNKNVLEDYGLVEYRSRFDGDNAVRHEWTGNGDSERSIEETDGFLKEPARRAVGLLREEGEPLDYPTIEEGLDWNKNKVSDVLGRLRDKGLVRRVDSLDGDYSRLKLSEDGETYVDEALRPLEELARQVA